MVHIPKNKKKSKIKKWIHNVASNRLLMCSIALAIVIVVLPYFFPFLSISTLVRYIEHLKWTYLTSAKRPPPLRKDIRLITDGVVSVQWNHSLPAQTVVREIVQGGKPVLIRNGPAANWPLAKWDILAFLMGGQDIVMEGVRWQREPVFVLGREREKGGMLGSPRDRPLLYINSTMASFLQTVFNESQYYYWSGELSSLEAALEMQATLPPPVPSDQPKRKHHAPLDWRSFKHIDSGLSDSIDLDDGDLWAPMIWLSHPGVVAQTHYDPQHNFLSQMQGNKRVILFPPSEEAMYLYPHIHRSYRQSQLHLEQGAHTPSGGPAIGGDASFPTIPSSGMEIILQPGETLYIPPYWHHRVESLTMAVSVSVTSPAHLEALFAEISWETVPFGMFSSKRTHKEVAVKLYLGLLFSDMLAAQVLGNMDMQAFSSHLYSSRYRPLFPPDELSATRGSFSCPSFPEEGSPLALTVQNSSRAFQQAAKKVSSMIQQVPAERQLKREFMGDYVEELVRWAVGPRLTVYFIHDCLK